jgi:hypothetical protein
MSSSNGGLVLDDFAGSGEVTNYRAVRSGEDEAISAVFWRDASH